MEKPNRNFSVYCTIRLSKGHTGKLGKVWQICFNRLLVKWDKIKVPVWLDKDQVEVVCYF